QPPPVGFAAAFDLKRSPAHLDMRDRLRQLPAVEQGNASDLVASTVGGKNGMLDRRDMRLNLNRADVVVQSREPTKGPDRLRLRTQSHPEHQRADSTRPRHPFCPE